MRPVYRNLLLLTLVAMFFPKVQGNAQSAPTSQTWVGSWAASQQIPEPQNALPPADLNDVTIRQIFHLSVGGSTLRVHLSNVFGTQPLHLLSVHIARPLSASSSTIDPASDRALSFAGSEDITVPAGTEYISDPI